MISYRYTCAPEAISRQKSHRYTRALTRAGPRCSRVRQGAPGIVVDGDEVDARTAASAEEGEKRGGGEVPAILQDEAVSEERFNRRGRAKRRYLKRALHLWLSSKSFARDRNNVMVLLLVETIFFFQ